MTSAQRSRSSLQSIFLVSSALILIELVVLSLHQDFRRSLAQSLMPGKYRAGMEALEKLRFGAPLEPGARGFDALAELIEECGVLYPLGATGEVMGSRFLYWMVRFADLPNHESSPPFISRIKVDSLADSRLIKVDFKGGNSISVSHEHLKTKIERNSPGFSLFRVLGLLLSTLAVHTIFLWVVAGLWIRRTSY
jgi:hypothetical protein